jgi:formamidopyrimidine-DNA glycosylase
VDGGKSLDTAFTNTSMPELPEVETVVRTLAPLVVGRKIIGAELRDSIRNAAGKPQPVRIFLNPTREIRSEVEGSRIEAVERFGKNIVFRLHKNSGTDTQSFLLVHLGMTGRLTCENTSEFRDRHTHMVLGLDAPGKWVHFSDIRRFGRVRITNEYGGEAGGALSDLGPDPLEISADDFVERVKLRRSMLKSLLLNQEFLRGLGNIYADESLFRAGIHPAALGSKLTRKRALALHEAIQQTLAHAIRVGGSSISNYVDAEGRSGFFQLEHQVYRRTGQPCTRCGAPIRKMIVATRSTHYCPKCQKK